MTRHISRILFAFAALVLLAPLAQAGTFLITPGATAYGVPGETVGWGFTITSDSVFIQITNSEFCEGAQTPPCTSTLGSYQDYIATNFTVVGPAPEVSPLSQSFDPVSQLGIGGFTIRTDAVEGNSIAGQIILSYDVYSVSPNDPAFDPSTNFLSSGTFSSDANIVVTPEPATFGLLGAALVALVAIRRGKTPVA